MYESWLGSIVEDALSRGGCLAPPHATMLAIRREEGNQALWKAGGELGEAARTYVARLLTIEDLLANLPLDR